MLDTDLDKKIRLKQAKLMLQTNSSVSFSEVINSLIRKCLQPKCKTQTSHIYVIVWMNAPLIHEIVYSMLVTNAIILMVHIIKLELSITLGNPSKIIPKGAFGGNRTPARGSTVPYTTTILRRPTKTIAFTSTINLNKFQICFQ